MKKLNENKFLKIITIIMIIIFLNILPIIFKKPINSKVISNNQISMIYQNGDDEGALEEFELLKKEIQNLYTKLNAKQTKTIKIYIYTSQFSLVIRKAGFITVLFAPSWYIGDSKNGEIFMVSPNTVIKGHTHETILNATLHELVHSIIFNINHDISYFWDNGIATFLSHQEPSTDELLSFKFPSLEDTKIENEIKFGNIGGYAFSYNYIEFLNKNYGWDRIMDYVKGGKSFLEVFGKSEEEMYNEWSKAFRENY